MPSDYDSKSKEISKEVLEMIENSSSKERYRKKPSKAKERDVRVYYIELGRLLEKNPEKWLIRIHQDMGPLSIYSIKEIYGTSRGRKVIGSDSAWFDFLKDVYGKSIKKQRLVRNENDCTELP
jgi:hypothetical protein